jgi:Na+:H+ antiporter
MSWVETLQSHILALPSLAKFAIFMAVIVGARPLSRRVHIPSIVLLLLFGVVLGPHLLDAFSQNRPVASFLGELGKLLLMFSAGLEIDLGVLRKSRRHSIIFGLLTTTIPLVFGTIYGIGFGYEVLAAIVIGSLLASHTLISLPIVTRLGIISLEPVIVTIGATVISDTLSLIVFAICVSSFTTGFSAGKLALQLAEIAVFVPLILLGIGRGGAYLLRQVGNDEDVHFVLMLGFMALAGMLADLINLPPIVGAFLAGLALNTAAAQQESSKARLDFLGRALFIPCFFIVTGMLIDPTTFANDLIRHFPLVIGMIASLTLGKAIAAAVGGRAFGYSPPARRTVWALTLPQVAATLAAAVVGHDTVNHAGKPLLDNTTLNAVLILMVVTSILGPVLTERFAPDMRSEVGHAK